MANMLDIVLKINDFVIILAKLLFGAIHFLLRYLWRFISLLVNLGSESCPLDDNKSKSKLKMNASPQISEDNSEASEEDRDQIDTMEASKSKSYHQAKKILENQPLQKKKHVKKVFAASGETELRKRIIDTSNNSEYDHCQVCGRNPPTMYCEGPRCYTFFCSECETLYHKHARRVKHIRKDISAYNPYDKPPVTFNIPFDLGVPSTSKAFQSSVAPQDLAAAAAALKTTATNVADITPPPTIQELAAAAAAAFVDDDDQMLGEAAALDANTWECKFCTFVNQMDTRICQVCCRTNTLLNPLPDVAQEVLEEEAPSPPPPMAPTKLTKGDNFNQTNNLYDQYWCKKNPAQSNSPTSSSKAELPQTSERGDQNTSPRDRGNTDQPKNTFVAKSRNTKPPQEFDEEVSASDNAMASEQPVESTEDTAATWICTFCTLVNSATTNICDVCGKSNPKVLLKKNPESEEGDSNATAQAWSDSTARQPEGTPTQSDNSNKPDTDFLALNFMQENHLENYEVAQLASDLVRKNFRLQDAIEAAKNCSCLVDALAYLLQECSMCKRECLTRDMIRMLHCTHRCCQSCTRKYFTSQIRNYDITAFVCAVCETPRYQQIETFDDTISEYFSDLSNLLKPILTAEDHELYQTKLRDWFLIRDPHFKRCPNCPYGGILQDKFTRMECPQCLVTTCLQCKKTWLPAHEGKSCEEYTAWQENPPKKKGANKNNKKNDQTKSSEPKKSLMKDLKGLFAHGFSSNSAWNINAVAQSNASANTVVTNEQMLTDQITINSYAAVANSQSNSSCRPQQLQDPQYQNNAVSTYTDHYQNPSQQRSLSNNSGANSERPRNFENNTSPQNRNNNTGGTNQGRSDYDTSQNYSSRESNNMPSRTQQIYNNPSSLHKTEIPTVSWECPKCTILNIAGVKICMSCGKSYDKHLIEVNRIEKSKLGTSVADKVAGIIKEAYRCKTETSFQRVHSGETGTHGLNQGYNHDDEQIEALLKSYESSSISSDSLANSSVSSKTIPMEWSNSPETREIDSTNIGNNYNESYNTNVASTILNTDYAASNCYQNKGTLNAKKLEHTKEAILRKVPLEDLHVAILHCGDGNPFEWLKENWQTNIAYVKLTASRELNNYCDVSATNIPSITDIEARNALIKHKGNCLKAVIECLEESQVKFLQRESVGELSPDAHRVLSESTRNNVGVATFAQERIISHKEIQNSFANRSRSMYGTYSNQSNDLPTSHVYENTNFTTRTPDLSSNSAVNAVLNSQFTRVNSAVDSAAITLTQSFGLASTTVQNQTSLSSASPATSRTNDGIHDAKPALADYPYKHGDLD